MNLVAISLCFFKFGPCKITVKRKCIGTKNVKNIILKGLKLEKCKLTGLKMNKKTYRDQN